METKELIFKAYGKYQALEIAAMSLKVGDSVKITRKATTHELGWQNQWNPEMDKFVEETSTITEIHSFLGISLSCGFAFPIFVLEKVKKDSIEVRGVKFRSNTEKTLKASYEGKEYIVSKEFIKECDKFVRNCFSPIQMLLKFGCIEFASKNIQQVRVFFKF